MKRRKPYTNDDAAKSATQAMPAYDAIEPKAPPPKGANGIDRQAKRPMRITAEVLAKARTQRQTDPFRPKNLHPPGVGPRKGGPGGAPKLAMDENIAGYSSWAADNWAAQIAQGALGSAFLEGQEFLGYPYLSILSQRAEYRAIVDTIAREATRKWIELQAVSEDDRKKKHDAAKAAGLDRAQPKDTDKTGRIRELTDYLDHLHVRQVFKKRSQDGEYFGRAHLYIDTGDFGDPDEMKAPLGSGRDAISRMKIKRNGKLSIRTIEAVWCYPNNYNSSNPLSPDWYSPQTWNVQGTEVHVSRLLWYVPHPVPDLLKPAYSFGGLAGTQLAKAYVDNFLRIRQSVADIVQAFSVMVLETDLSETLTAGGDEIFKRAGLFNLVRANNGLMMINKDTEGFSNVAAPLGTLDMLQAQAQEHMAACRQIPIVKLLGIQPAGLNADSEGIMRSFYDTIEAYQESDIRDDLTKVVDFAQLALWGAVDDEITIAFRPLWTLDEKGKAEVDKIRAETGVILVDGNVLHPEEERGRIAADPDSPWQGLDADDVPEPPEMTAGGESGEGGEESEAGGTLEPTKIKSSINVAGNDEESFREEDHPREEHGRFTSGGRGSAKAGHEKTKVENGRRVTESGNSLPAHIESLKIPPGWTDVTFNPNPKGALQATGKDSKGRPQAVYSSEFSASQAADKFSRINELNEKISAIVAQNEEARRSKNQKTRAAADCAFLVMSTGIRPGSNKDTGAEKKAYGATTLEGRHVAVDADGQVRLRFVGKKGVDLDLPVTDKAAAEMLLARKEKAGDGGKLFEIDEKALLDHVHSLDGGGFKTKDFRTHLGTSTAVDEVKKQKPPTNEKEYRKAVMAVAKTVSAKLGNTPQIALQAYIDPSVFSKWRMGA